MKTSKCRRVHSCKNFHAFNFAVLLFFCRSFTELCERMGKPLEVGTSQFERCDLGERNALGFPFRGDFEFFSTNFFFFLLFKVFSSSSLVSFVPFPPMEYIFRLFCQRARIVQTDGLCGEGKRERMHLTTGFSRGYGTLQSSIGGKRRFHGLCARFSHPPLQVSNLLLI